MIQYRGNKRGGIMLCYPFEERRLLKWKAPYVIQPKLDGERCRAIIDENGRITLLSSELNQIGSVPHIVKELAKTELKGIELDGELYIHGEPLERIHSIVSRKQNLHPDYEQMEYHIFDIVNSKGQLSRLMDLNRLSRNVPRLPSPTLKVVPWRMVSGLDEIEEFMNEVCGDGYEGIVVRSKEGLYVRKRSTDMMKFKPKKEDIYEVYSITEAISKEGIPKGMVGTFNCIGSDGTIFPVNAGKFNHAERQEIFQNQERYKGRLLRIHYQNITASGGVPRFSRAIEWADQEHYIDPGQDE